MRGASVTRGYFNCPALIDDRSIFAANGWFKTGDIGQWNEDEALSSIGRLKNLLKMQSGEVDNTFAFCGFCVFWVGVASRFPFSFFALIGCATSCFFLRTMD